MNFCQKHGVRKTNYKVNGVYAGLVCTLCNKEAREMDNRMIWNCEHCGQFMLEVGVLGTIELKDCGSCGKSNLVVLHKRPVTERDYRLLLKAAIKSEVTL